MKRLPPFTRRRRWLARRVKHDRTRPRPLVVRVVNCASVTFPAEKANQIWLRALTEPGKHGMPDLVLACEMGDVDGNFYTKPRWVVGHRWQVVQPAAGPDGASWLALAVRRDRGRLYDPKVHDGSRYTPEGRGINPRPILTARLVVDPGTDAAWTLRVGAGHAPPPRAPRARGIFLAAFARRSRVELLAGDLNIDHGRARALMPHRRIYTIGVLHAALRRWIPSAGPWPVHHGSDHPGVDLILWPDPKENAKD